MRKVVFYTTLTFKRIISDANDGIYFLDPYGELKWDLDKINALMARTDTILMARRTYEVVQ